MKSEVAARGVEVVAAELAGIVGGDHVIAATAEDAVDGVQPRWVVEPGSTTEASEILRLANEAGLAVVIRGAGTKLGLGNPPERLDLILSTGRLNQVLEHAAGDLVARLEPGVRLRDAQETFRQAGQWLPIDPPEPDATVGGIIAANTSGPHRLRYGTMRDLLIGVTYVLPNGTTAKSGGKVVKNVAGYDLGKLFTGSLGTLALLTEVIVRLHPLPAASRTVTLRRDEAAFAEASAAVAAILHSTLVAGAIQIYCGQGMTLSVLFEGVEPGVVAQSEQAAELWRPFGEVSIGEPPVTEAPRSFDPGSTRLKVSAPIAALAEVLATAMAAARASKSGRSISSHAGSGITYLEMDGEIDLQIKAIAELRRRISQLGGSVVIERAPVELKRAIDVWGEAGETLPLMQRVKERFDPRRTLSPGRFIGGI